MANSKASSKQEKKVQIRRDAGTGRIVTKKYADSHPKTTVTEIIKKKI